LIDLHPLPPGQANSITDWRASSQGLAAVRDFNSAPGHQLPLGADVECFRLTPLSGPYLKLIDWPKGAKTRREQSQQMVPYSITSSAMARSGGVAHRPNMSAVRLIADSDLVAPAICSR